MRRLALFLLALAFLSACGDSPEPAPDGAGPELIGPTPDLIGPTPGERPPRPLPDTGAVLSPEMKAVLENADFLELFAIDPESEMRGESVPEEENFHGFRILGRAPLEDSGRRHELVRLYYQAVFRSEGMTALCFLPRHAIRATRGDEQVDVLACFECFQLRWWGPGDAAGSAAIDNGDVAAVDALYAGAGLTIAR